MNAFKYSSVPATILAVLVLAGCTTASPPPAAPAIAPVAAPAPLHHAEARLIELKLQLPPPGKPSATLRPAVITGNLIFVSGHVARAADGKLMAGRVGDDLTVDQGRAAARQCGLAILSTLKNEVGNLARVRRLVKVLGMVNCSPGFKDQPAVINGCSELFIEVFGPDAGLAARSAVGVGSLPGNVAVEIEAIFELQ